MKNLKVYDDTHKAVKVKAAESGRTTTSIASSLINLSIRLIDAGKAKLPEAQTKEAGQ